MGLPETNPGAQASASVLLTPFDLAQAPTSARRGFSFGASASAGALYRISNVNVAKLVQVPYPGNAMVATAIPITGVEMRVFIACAIIVTAAIGLGGCFHHQQAVVEQPISHTPLK